MKPEVSIVLELEVDSTPHAETTLFREGSWVGDGPLESITIRLDGREPGHGFGISEIVTIVVSIGASAASDLVADAVRASVGRIIRSVRGRRSVGDGSRDGLEDVIEAERDPDPDGGTPRKD
ncbi:hypothetical protein Drose_25375 [Dactylosporangium roseum]|uniref:Uncharacterized protein n=1 Tax=Dactylosporangium roseum TaxID=47989 RepID=A0ABY5Z0C1_9ACTN|nr:hypothetical protein [Dactylosporangium roseum]UWZ34543.1 hypothetical protein Drose_25375 [Dactylosporangium roseum]